MISLFSGAPADPEDYTAMEKHGAEALYPAVKSLIHAIQTKDKEAQQDAAHQIFQIPKSWTITWWSESIVANGKSLLQIAQENVHLNDLEWTEEEQIHLKTLVERYTSRGASEAWRVQRWGLLCFLLVLEHTEDGNDVSRQWQDEWPLDTWVESAIFRSLRETFLPMFVKEPAVYPEPDQVDASRQTLLPEGRNDNALPSAPRPQ